MGFSFGRKAEFDNYPAGIYPPVKVLVKFLVEYLKDTSIRVIRVKNTRQSVTMSLPKLTESIIRSGTPAQSFQRGQAYYYEGAISNTSRQGNILRGECAGTQEPFYYIQVELDEAGIAQAQCTCPYDYGGYCKHIVALLLAYAHHPKRFTLRQEPAELLADLSQEDLIALVTKLLQDKPELYDWVEAAISVPPSSGKTTKKKRKKVDAEVYRRQIVGILHSLDRMRASEAYWQVGGLVEELRQVQATAMNFLDAGDAETAQTILLTLLEESSRGIEFIDDSNGELGGFVGSVGQPLAEAILHLDLNAIERTKLADRLTRLARYASDYGMEGDLDIAIQAAQYGWDEPPSGQRFQRQVADKEDEWIEEDENDELNDEDFPKDYAWSQSPSSFGDLTEAKLNVLERQGRTDDYLALCQQAKRHLRYALKLCDLKRVPEAVKRAKKNLASADEARQLAERLRSLKHIAEALEIGQRGLKLKGPKAALGEWLGPVEEAQGRTPQALAAWRAAFPENPSLETYKTLKRLSGAGWKNLRPELMAKLKGPYHKQVLAEVLLFEDEWDKAIKVAEGREVWYPVVETVADAVLPYRPEWVARISLKNAERLMAEPKSKNYPFAAEWLKRAKKAYALLGQTDEWRAYLRKVTEKYQRRPALQAQLKQL
jgi:uncharacterized Zn finger protein